MERIKILLQNIITSANIYGDENIEIAARTFLGSIERDCIDEFATTCEHFTQQKVEEIIFLEQVKQMIKSN